VARIAERSNLSPQEFLAWERQQPTKHEYFRGEVFAMAGGSPRHNALCANVLVRLRDALGEGPCNVFTSDQRVSMHAGERYVYPDVTVVCGSLILQTGTSDVVENPAILVEVLSSSTEQYDRELNWEGYQRLPSLSDYLLVSQSEARIEHFRRESSGTWVYRSAVAGDRVTLSNGATVDVDAVFGRLLELPGDA
jgi:Uma2 family endonuclease